MRFSRTLPAMVRFSSDIRRSRSLSSGHFAQNGGLRRTIGGGGGAAAGVSGEGWGGSAGDGTASVTPTGYSGRNRQSPSHPFAGSTSNGVVAALKKEAVPGAAG